MRNIVQILTSFQEFATALSCAEVALSTVGELDVALDMAEEMAPGAAFAHALWRAAH